MKEYKTLRVSPEEESSTIKYMQRFNWELESSQEVYNEREEFLGAETKTKEYGSFMQGYTGQSGKSETIVHTRVNVTHYISMRFAREKDTPNYNRIVQQGNKIDKYSTEHLKPQKEKTKWRFLYILGAVLLFLCVASFGGGESAGLGIGFGVGGMLTIVLGIIITRKRQKALDEEYIFAEKDYNKKETERKQKLKKAFEELDQLVFEDRNFLSGGSKNSVQPQKELKKDSFNLYFESAGERKMDVITAIRDFRNIGLSEARKIIENKGLLVSGATEEQADEIIELFEQLGAVVVAKVE